MKKCFRCGRLLPIEDFYRHPMMGDGRLGKCKECTKADVRANRRAKRQEYSLYDQQRQQSPERKRAKREAHRRHNERHPDRYRARDELHRAVRKGLLIRQPCEVCGNPKSQAHHEDYSRPLDVRWLCFKCHREKAHGQTVVAQI